MRWVLDDGHELRFCDPRRFGTGELALGTAARDAFFAARLGLEPLDGELTGEALRRMARGRRAPVKAFLLDQRRIAGVGQHLRRRGALPRAHPSAAPGRQPHARAVRRAGAARCARRCRPASRPGGATIDDFRHADGVQGAFQNEFLVHLRRGEPCPRCGDAGGQVRRGGARDVRVRELPAASAAPAR